MTSRSIHRDNPIVPTSPRALEWASHGHGSALAQVSLGAGRRPTLGRDLLPSLGSKRIPHQETTGMPGTLSRRIATLALPLGAIAFTASAGCNSRDVAAVDPLLDREQLAEIPIELNRDLDLIFIVDDSSSMDPNQDALIANFPRFIEVLSGIEGGLPNVHIAVISTDVGADPTPLGEPFVAQNCDGVGHDGRFIVGPQDVGCPGINDQWLIDVADEDGTRIRNYDGELADRFTCMATLETGGCGFEMPLEALRRALEHPDNQGFFRDDAHLGVVILSDEDDCSVHDLSMMGDDPRSDLSSTYGPLDSFRCTDFGVRCDPVDCEEFPGDLRCEGPRQNCEPDGDSPYMYPPDYYADIVLDFKNGDANKVIVAGIIGDVEPVEVFHDTSSDGLTRARLRPSCDTSAGNADPGVRLEAFLQQFSNRESTSICDGDLSGPVEAIARRFVAVFGSPCIGGQLRDTQPDEPGIQPECIVADVSNPGTNDEVEFLLPECNGDQSNVPCWYMEQAEQCSGTPTGLALEIERGDTSPPQNTTIRARCVADG
jgi:hypothetical protein